MEIINMPDLTYVEIFLSFVTLISSSLLGLVVYRQDRKSWTNRLFFILSFFISAYIVVNYLSLHPPLHNPENQLFWIRLVMFITSLIGPTVFLLVNTFPKKNITLKRRYLAAVFVLMIASSTASLLPFVFKSIEYPNGEPMPIPGPGIFIFLADFVGLFLLSFIILIFKYKKSVGLERIKQKYFLFGIIISFFLMALTTVIFVVVLKTSAMVFLGPIYPVVLIASIFYAIVKHQMFNIKIFTTKALIIVVWCIFFAKIFISIELVEIVMNIFIFLLVVLFGILLIRSVHKEIDQREKISKLAKSLETDNSRLKELDELKTEFLSIASHQLRTPLSIIKGYTSLLEEGAYGRPNEKMMPIFHNIDESNERLIKLVDEFLNVSRIEQGRIQYNMALAKIVEIINSVVTELKERAATKHTQIKLLMPDAEENAFSCDEEKIRHAVYNFVDNAIKYSPEHSIVEVKMDMEDGGVSVKVTDKGVGLDKKDIENLFQKFYRSPHIMRDFQGTGLGLFVVRQFIEGHKGRVWAKSKGVGKGSEFGFWIPSASK